MDPITELFFCPQHGLCRPQNWPMLMIMLPAMGFALRHPIQFLRTLAANLRFRSNRKHGSF